MWRFITKVIRLGLYKGYWESYANAKKKAEVLSGDYYIPKAKDKSWKKYKCEHCDNIFRANEIKRDHITES